MKRLFLFIIVLLLSLIPVISFTSTSIILMPNSSAVFNNQQNISNLTSHYFGVSSQGNTSILTPNHAGAYIGVDSHGKSVIITPLRGNLGVDSRGNLWTIRSR
jgi:hypothetical protein